LFFCNVVTPQFLWFKSIRRNVTLTFIISIFVNIGMWSERFMIAVASLATDYLASSCVYYSSTGSVIITYVGIFVLVFVFFLLFLRFLPMIAIAEVKKEMPQADPHNYDDETKEFIEGNTEPVLVQQEQTV